METLLEYESPANSKAVFIICFRDKGESPYLIGLPR